MDNPFLSITISLEIFGAVTSLIIVICLVAGEEHRERLNRIFMLVALGNMVNLMSDAVANLFRGHDTPAAFIMVRAGNFLMYVTGYVLTAIFADYVVTFVGQRAEISRRIVYVMYGLCGIAVLMVVISQFNGMYYSFVGPNLYTRGYLFWISQAWGVLFMVMIAGIILCYRRYMRLHEALLLLSDVLLPAITIIIQFFLYGLSLASIATTLSVVAIYIGIQVEQSKQSKQRELELANAQIAVMISQIKPHFLWNVLSGIKSLCDTDPPRASEALEHFSFYLRGNLNALTDDQLIPFQKELELMQDYLYLEKMRFGERLRIEWDIGYKDFWLPPLSVQPLLDNAIRHGIMKKPSGGTLTIRSEKKGAEAIITVRDDGAGFDIFEIKEDGRPHIGIENTRRRLNALCGGSLVIESKKEVGTTVKMILPQKDIKRMKPQSHA